MEAQIFVQGTVGFVEAVGKKKKMRKRKGQKKTWLWYGTDIAQTEPKDD